MIGVLTIPLGKILAGAFVEIDPGHVSPVGARVRHGSAEVFALWSQIDLLQPSSGWSDRGLCAGGDPAEWELVGRGKHSPEVVARAKAQCAGCPVLYDCAIDTVRHGDVSVIRAGAALPEGPGAAAAVMRDVLHDLGLPQVPSRRQRQRRAAMSPSAPALRLPRTRYSDALREMAATGTRFTNEDVRQRLRAGASRLLISGAGVGDRRVVFSATQAVALAAVIQACAANDQEEVRP